MTVSRKADARGFKRVLAELQDAPWLGTARRWWPGYVFHVTDVQNAVGILREGALLSRQGATDQGFMVTENASPGIIDQTPDQWKAFVRFYFRPRTPTHYESEGFRPRDQRHHGAHCPVPVCFLFDSYGILSMLRCRFSDGNLAARNATVFSTAEEFGRLPFQGVYHDSWLSPDEKSTIVFHRNAEIIVPDRVGLEALKGIFCRSQAEYETLLHLLSPRTRRRWGASIGLGRRLNLFNKQWTFVETAELRPGKVTVNFSQSSTTPGPFRVALLVTDTVSGTTHSWSDDSYMATGKLVVSLERLAGIRDYAVRLLLDEQLAYAGRYQEEDLPW